MITSTLSQSNFLKDKRIIMNQKRALMTHEQLVEYIDEKAAYKALVKEHVYQTGHTKDKDKEYRDNYMKSFIHRSEFKSKTLQKFKERVRNLNSNYKKIVPKPKHVEKEEKLRHQQNQNASQKRGLPDFNLENAKRLLDGNYHDMVEEDEGAVTVNQNLQADPSKNVYASTREGIQRNV